MPTYTRHLDQFGRFHVTMDPVSIDSIEGKDEIPEEVLEDLQGIFNEDEDLNP